VIRLVPSNGGRNGSAHREIGNVHLLRLILPTPPDAVIYDLTIVVCDDISRQIVTWIPAAAIEERPSDTNLGLQTALD